MTECGVRASLLRFVVFLFVGLLAACPYAAAQKSPAPAGPAFKKKAKDEDEAVRQRMEWFYRQRAFPLGYIPEGARGKALQELDRMLEREGRLVRLPNGTIQELAAISATTWTPIGPQPTASMFFGNTSGRVTALAVDPTNPNIAYLGGAFGGVWKTINAGLNWTPLTDAQASTAMGAIVIDPTSCGPAGPCKTIYAGTGEENFALDSYYGAGVLKSTDGGNTWTQLGAGVFFNTGGASISARSGGARIAALAISPNGQILLAAVQGAGQGAGSVASGIYRSADGGNSWSPVLTGAPGTEVLFHPKGNTIAYAALGSILGNSANGVYKSIDGGLTWAAVNGAGALPSGTDAGRIEIAIAPSSPATLYASIQDPRMATFGSLLGFFQTTNGGATWTNLSNTPDYCAPQCWYDNVVRVHPLQASTVFAGGSARGTVGWVLRSNDAGATWQNISQGGGVVLHVDQHAMAFSANGSRLYVGNDGGAYRTDDSAASSISWVNLNNALNITQFYPGVSIHPSSEQAGFGGTQDNGTQIYSGNLAWSDTNACGDGGWTAIDPATPSTVYAACQDIDVEKSAQNGGLNTFLPAVNGLDFTDMGAFIPPFVIDPSLPQRLYFGTFRLWQTTDGATTWTAISGDVTGGGGATLSTIAVAPSDSKTVYTGSNSGHVQVSTNVAAGSAAFTDASLGLPGRVVTQIAVDPLDARTAYVTFSGFNFGTDTLGHVFKTTNGGILWTTINGNLPNIPVNDIVIDPDDASRQTLYVATDVGVFQTTNGGGTWSALGTGLPRVAVLSLKLREASRTLRAATHGRGVWDLLLPNLAGTPAFVLSSIQPFTAQAGASGFTLTANGKGFTASSVVRWNGSNRTTSCTLPTQCTANILTGDLASAAVAQITVFDPGQASPTNALSFTVTGAAPSISQLTPSSAAAGAANLPLTANGSNFNSGSKVSWNGTPLPSTTFVSSTQVTTAIPASLLAFGGINAVTVVNPPPGGGPSNALAFTVTALPPANDNFANATTVTSSSFSNTEDTSGATIEATDPAPSCTVGLPGLVSNGRANSVWYRLVAGGSGSVTVDTVGSSYDTILTVVTGAPGSFTEVVCNDDITTGIVVQSRVTFNVTSGTTYFLMVTAYSGGGGKLVFNVSTTVPVQSADFALSSPTGAQSVNAGQPATYTISVAAQGGTFASAVTLSCNSLTLPVQASCSFNPASVTPGASSANSTLTIATTARSAVPSMPPPGVVWRLRGVPIGWLVVFAALLGVVLALRVFATSPRAERLIRRGPWIIYLPLAVLFCVLLLKLSGCSGMSSGGGPPPNGTPIGTYTVTVTGISGGASHSTMVTLIVR